MLVMDVGIDVEITVAYTQGSFVFPNPWQRAVGKTTGRSQAICCVGFGVSPISDCIYIDGLDVAQELRRRGYASNLLLKVVDFVAHLNNDNRYPITPLHETWSSQPFWNALRSRQVPGLEVNQNIRIAEMHDEAKRWKSTVVSLTKL